MPINNSVIVQLVTKRNQVEVIILIREEAITVEETITVEDIILMILTLNQVTGYARNVKIIIMQVKISVTAQVAI